MQFRFVLKEGETADTIAKRLRAETKDPTIRVEACEPPIEPAEGRVVCVRFRAERLRVVMEERDGSPMADAPYSLYVQGLVLAGQRKADATGTVDVCSPHVGDKVELRIDTHIWNVTLVDSFASVDTVAGQRQRLMALGYGPANESLWSDEETKKAIRKFQIDHGVGSRTGVADTATLEALQREHSR